MNTLEPIAKNRELISALVDGELGRDEFQSSLFSDALCDDATGSWNSYLVIGDVLRASTPVMALADSGFVTRVSERLAQVSIVGVEVVSDVAKERSPAANDGNFRRKLLSGFAAGVAVCAITWTAMEPAVPTNLPQIALASPTHNVVVPTAQGPVVRDAKLEELLAAHRQLGATSLQVPSGFLRNATFEPPQSAGR